MNKLIKLGCLSVLLGVAACTTIKPEKTDEDRVTVYANQRWKALIIGNLDKAYTFELPEYKKIYSVKHFKGRITSGTWKNAEVKSVKCKQRICIAKINIDVKIFMGGGFGWSESSGIIEEQWMKSSVDNDWYHFSNQ